MNALINRTIPAALIVLASCVSSARPGRDLFFDKESGLLVRTEGVMESAMGAVPYVSSLSDYRRTGDVLLAWRIEVEIMGQQRVITTTGVEQNVEMPEGIFDIPDDIEALLKKDQSR